MSDAPDHIAKREMARIRVYLVGIGLETLNGGLANGPQTDRELLVNLGAEGAYPKDEVRVNATMFLSNL